MSRKRLSTDQSQIFGENRCTEKRQRSESRQFWLITRDDRLCPYCREIKRLNADGVPIGAPFRTPDGVIDGPPRITMNLRYRITLTSDEQAQLRSFVQGGKGAFRRLKRAQILLAAASGSADADIAANVGVGTSTVYRTKRRFVEEGLGALDERPRPGARPRLSEKAEARLVAEACSHAPEGRGHWTMRLLAGRVVELGLADACSHETVRRVLKKSGSSHG